MKPAGNFFHWIIIAFMPALHGCVYDKKELPQPVLPQDTTLANCDTAAVVTYTSYVKSMLETNCTVSGCHDASVPDELNYTTYPAIKAKVDNGSFEIRVLHIKDMPQPNSPGPTSLDTCTLYKLRQWVDAGGPE